MPQTTGMYKLSRSLSHKHACIFWSNLKSEDVVSFLKIHTRSCLIISIGQKFMFMQIITTSFFLGVAARGRILKHFSLLPNRNVLLQTDRPATRVSYRGVCIQESASRGICFQGVCVWGVCIQGGLYRGGVSIRDGGLGRPPGPRKEGSTLPTGMLSWWK